MANATMMKFGYPDTLLREGTHWVLLARPAQVTLGSLVLCTTGEATAYGELPPEAFAEQQEFVALAERVLGDFVHYDRINYLMLMMVDPHVHFHVIPRYESPRTLAGLTYPDSGWPGPPNLSESIPLNTSLLSALRAEVGL